MNIVRSTAGRPGLMRFADAIRTTYLPFPYSLCLSSPHFHIGRCRSYFSNSVSIGSRGATRFRARVCSFIMRLNRTRAKPISDECSHVDRHGGHFPSVAPEPERGRLIASHWKRLTRICCGEVFPVRRSPCPRPLAL